MQERVYCTPILDIADLKQRLLAAWSGLQQHVIDEASTSDTEGCTPTCVTADGRH